MPSRSPDPVTPCFRPVPFRGDTDLSRPPATIAGAPLAAAMPELPTGAVSGRGIPFRVGRVVLLRDRAVTLRFAPVAAPWWVFLHTADLPRHEANSDGFFSPARGHEPLAEPLADYIIGYADGTEARIPVRRRREIASFRSQWPQNGLETVPHRKPFARTAAPDQAIAGADWGWNQTRGGCCWKEPVYWLWAWSNPRPRAPVRSIRLEPRGHAAIVFAGLAAGRASEHPLRWRARRAVVVRFPEGVAVPEVADAAGNFPGIGIDLGQIIAVTRRRRYPTRDWTSGYDSQLPDLPPDEALVEYTSHADARLVLPGGRIRTVAAIEKRPASSREPLVEPVTPADQPVALRVIDRATSRPVAVKLHVHGQAGDYLAPVDRNRYPNPFWFQDFSVDYTHQGAHHCCYIDGVTHLRVPLGRVYVEISKGFEIRPIRAVRRVTRATRELVFEIESVLPWRSKGWVTADTHVHFLSPQTALLEGAGEGVNVVNLLASQWGELMTNVGDFDGRTTHGALESGGGGEHLVRVGTENRQAVLGHISLLGYRGPIIAPMTVGGPDESALGDPVECRLLDWARQCRRQRGLVVLPHFPHPRLENASVLLSGAADAVEMTSGGDRYGGIDPYSLSDWYRFLNCGLMTAAVGGTDKMSAMTAIGTVRTYARLAPGEPFTYEAWKRAVRRARTFVTYGPLLEFSVDGRPAGSRIALSRGGGTLSVTWEVASVALPMTRVDLVVNGEIRESRSVNPEQAAGCFSVRIGRSSWVALLVRGRRPDRPHELIAAHTSPVMVPVAGTPFGSAADSLTILDQIEGALAFLDTVGTRAGTAAYRRLRLELTAAHRDLHNRMHRLGHGHGHAPGRPGDHRHGAAG